MRDAADAGRRTCVTRGGAIVPLRVTLDTGGEADTLQRVQWSQAEPGIRSRLSGACSLVPTAWASLWQMTESGSPTTDPAGIGTMPSRIVCSATT